MLKRLKNLWELSASNEAVDAIRNNIELMSKPIKIVGDGKAVFLGEGTAEEYEQQVKQDKGTDKWYKRIMNL